MLGKSEGKEEKEVELRWLNTIPNPMNMNFDKFLGDSGG